MSITSAYRRHPSTLFACLACVSLLMAIGLLLPETGHTNTAGSSPYSTLNSHVVDPEQPAIGTPAPADQGSGASAATATPAATVTIEGTVDVNGLLRIRAWPWGKIIGSLNNGDKVQITGTSGDFYAITYEGKTAYIHRNYVNIPGKAAGTYGIKYPAGCAEGGKGYLPRPTKPGQAAKPAPTPTATKPAPEPAKPQPEAAKPGKVDLSDAKTIGDVRGDGTRVGAVAWGLDQMPGGKQRGINSNNGKRSSDSSAWNHYCLAFVSTCWGRKVADIAAASAYLAYKQCKARGRTFHKSGVPAPGAAMFFGQTSGNPYGHAIIATGEVDKHGDPIILSTSGWGGLKGIQKMPLSQMKRMMGSAPFYGWVNLP